MNFDIRLDNIRKKYNLFYQEADINYLNNRMNRIEGCIKNLFLTHLYKKKIAIRGAGQATEELFNILEKFNGDVKNMIVCVIDKYKNGNNILGVPVVSPDMIEQFEIDVIVLNSFKYRSEMNIEYSEIDRIEIIDIYDYFSESGMYFDGEFYLPTDLRTFYLTINYYKKKFEKSDEKNKEMYLKFLVSCYLSIRDFENAYMYINQYAKLYCECLFDAKDEIEQLLCELGCELYENEKKHIIILWLDQLRYKDIEQMPFLKKFSGEKILFEKCYTQNLQTSTTFKMMFSKRDVLDEKAYNINKIDENNSPIYNQICSNHYDFRYIGWGKNNVYFDGISAYSLEKDNCILSLNIWKMFMDILRNCNNSVYLIHSFESHEHHFCGYMKDGLYDVWKASFEQFVDRYNECVKYIDQQLKFYLSYFNSNWSKIIMSDHGQELENVYKFDENVNYNKEKYKYGRWSEDSLHTVMIVDDKNWGKTRVKGLFSLVQFYEILETIFCKEWKIKENDYIKIQSMPFYSEAGLKKINDCQDYKFAMLVKGIIYKDYKYLKYASGEEEFYKNGNDDNNIIGEICDNVILDECRKLCGEIDYSIYEETKYSGAKQMLNKYIIKKERV